MDTIALKEQAPSTDDPLSVGEFSAALDDLSEDDKIKLAAIEKRFLGGTDFQWGELFHEAVCRALLGERHCPKRVPVMAFLIETMRSIAGHSRARAQKFVSLDTESDVLEGTRGKLLDTLTAEGQLNPEECLIAQDEAESDDILSIMQAHFDGDEECQLLLLGWAEGLRGKELRDFLKVDQARLDYLGKKVRRTLDKHYPNGWQK